MVQGCGTLMQVLDVLSCLPPNPESWLGGEHIESYCHLAGGVPERTAAASTAFGCASWTCMKTKWSSSQRHPTRSFSGLRGAADRWVQPAFPLTLTCFGYTNPTYHPAVSICSAATDNSY